jgi:hypothetical protein
MLHPAEIFATMNPFDPALPAVSDPSMLIVELAPLNTALAAWTALSFAVAVTPEPAL